VNNLPKVTAELVKYTFSIPSCQCRLQKKRRWRPKHHNSNNYIYADKCQNRSTVGHCMSFQWCLDIKIPYLSQHRTFSGHIPWVNRIHSTHCGL